MMRIAFSAAFAAALVITGSNAQPSGTFRQAHEYGYGEQSSLDPISKGRVFQITDKLMNLLVRRDLDGRPSPDLAVSWEANSEATEWTLKLREGVRFHDGTDFDASDVVYSLNRVLDPENDSPARAAIAMISSIDMVDSHTVRLVLDTPFADLPLQLMDYRLRIIPEGSGDSIAQTGIGTGPFKLEKIDLSGTTVIVANMDYYEGPPGVERMEVVAIPDAQARLQALLGGQIDMERGITPQQRVMFDGSANHYIQEIPTGNWRGIVFRTDVEPFSDPRVRKAVRIAADRQALLALVEGGNGTVACDAPVGPADQYRADMSCEQDIEGAKALLAEAGYPDGIDIEIPVSTVEATWPAIAESYQSQVEDAGIRVNISQVPSDGYWNEVWMKRDIAMTRWNERSADQVLHEVYHSTAKWNESFFKHEEFDDLLASARKELDFEKRKAIYVKAQEYLYENAGTLIPYHVTKLVGVANRVKNLDPVEVHTVRWHRLTVED